MSVSEQIDQFIAENGGNARDALNVAITRLYLAKKEIEFLKKSLELYHSVSTEFESGGRIEANPKMIEFLIKQEEKLPKQETDPHIKGYQIAKEKLKGYLPDDNFSYDDIHDIIADAYAEGWIDHKEKSIRENLPDSQ